MTLYVAPHTGAWIETIISGCSGAFVRSLPIRERGLKPGEIQDLTAWKSSRSPYGSVD